MDEEPSTFVKYLLSMNAIISPLSEKDAAGENEGANEFPEEIVIALTRPQGTDNSGVLDYMKELLPQHGYGWKDIDLADLLGGAATFISSEVPNPALPADFAVPGFTRATSLMKWGDFFRRTMTSYEMARFAIADIVNKRPAARREAAKDHRIGIAYVIQNLMHPEEVELLRAIYRRRLFLVATHQPRDAREAALAAKFKSNGDISPKDHAELIVRIDAGDRPAELPDAFAADIASDGNALNINDTFHHADVFVDSVNYKATIKRWIDQLFGDPWGTPNTDEFGMSVAFSAARSSASLGRSVGAAIFATDGSLAAVGWNDPAHPRGGVSKEGSEPPLRDHEVPNPGDPSDENRLAAVQEILQRLFGAEWESFYTADKWPDHPTAGQRELRDWLAAMRETAKSMPVTTNMVQAMPVLRPLATARIFNLIEFGRSVHAEMAAITDAARRGVSTQDTTMYVTTFPCHECARNIVAAGVTRLVFVEPYAKSMTKELYDMSILNRSEKAVVDSEKILFEPFLGISPRRFDELFSASARKVGLNEAATKGDAQVRAGQLVNWGKPPSTVLRRSIYTEFPPGLGNSFREALKTAEDEIVGSLKDHLNRAFPWIPERLKNEFEQKTAI